MGVRGEEPCAAGFLQDPREGGGGLKMTSDQTHGGPPGPDNRTDMSGQGGGAQPAYGSPGSDIYDKYHTSW